MAVRGLALVIEDDQDISDLIGLILEDAGFNTEKVQSAAAGLQAAAILQPVLITLDVGLPDMDGRDAARGLLTVCRAPIIMITAQAGVDSELEAMAAGAVAHLDKPFRPAQLRALAEQLCPEQ